MKSLDSLRGGTKQEIQSVHQDDTMRNNVDFTILCTLATFCLYLLAQILYVTTPIHVIHSNPSF